MALSAATVLEVRTTGSDTNGGGFVTGASGTDWSQQDSAQYSVTDGVTAGTTTITSATASFGTDVVGNIMYVQGGTGSVTAGWYQITARSNSTTITVDRSTGLTSGTGVTLKIGGALASLGKAAGLAIDGNTIWQASGTYLITSTTANASGGRVLISSGVHVQGYGVSRGDYATRPINKASGISSAVLLQFGNPCERARFDFIEVDGDSLTSIGGFSNSGGTASNCVFIRCVARNCTANGFFFSIASMTLVYCIATGCSGTVAYQGGGTCMYCVASYNSVPGFGTGGAIGPTIGCISFANTGSSGIGFNCANVIAPTWGCVAYNNGGSGFRSIGGSSKGFVANGCIAYGNSGSGFEFQSSDQGILIACAGGNNTSGNITNPSASYALPSLIALTADPFDTAAISALSSTSSISDIFAAFRPNNTSGGGALVRSAGGIPFADIGAVQHQDSGGGGGAFAGMHGGFVGG